MRHLIVSIHDVTPRTAGLAARWRELTEARTGGPAALLVVPRYAGRETWSASGGLGWLGRRRDAGDELVLHGYAHVSSDGRDERELRGRAGSEVRARIVRGLAELRGLGLDPRGFVAPCYHHPPAADEACRAAGLDWWATRAHLRSTGGIRRLPSLGVGASTALKRTASPTAARLAARTLAPSPAVRLDLHPADLADRRLRVAGLGLLDLLLDQGRAVTRHADLVPTAAAAAA